MCFVFHFSYALNHPTVSYCQGMSDLASPLLVTMGDEAHAYICFCALMKRLHSNFLLDGIVMTLKFQHLAEGLLYYDPEFYAYLKSHQVSSYIQNMNNIHNPSGTVLRQLCVGLCVVLGFLCTSMALTRCSVFLYEAF